MDFPGPARARGPAGMGDRPLMAGSGSWPMEGFRHGGLPLEEAVGCEVVLRGEAVGALRTVPWVRLAAAVLVPAF